jgi:hypothetical protein
MRRALGIAILFMIIAAPVAQATAPIPYTDRTHAYTGWSGVVRGDIRTIGMAGAMVGLGNTFIASGDNPAGLAMTLPGVQLQVTGNRIHDGDLQEYEQTLKTNNLGLAASLYPYGFSVGWWTPHNEGQKYVLPDGRIIDPRIEVNEFRLSAAHVLFHDRFSLGASVIFGKAMERLSFPDQPSLDRQETSYSVGLGLGAMIKLPRRVILGVAFTPSMHYSADPGAHPTEGISRFFEPVHTPVRMRLGLGWIPNRFFSAGAGVYFLGATQNTALLGDDSRSIGELVTLQPRVGAEYRWAEFKEFKADLALGTYLVPSRIQNSPTRLHGTFGTSFNLWVVNLGWGIDVAPRYTNYIYTAAIDVLRLFRKLDLIREDWHPPNGGLFPPMTRYSEDGLPRPLVKNWSTRKKPTNILEIGKEFPERLQKKVEELQKVITGETPRPAPSPAPKARTKHRRKRR